jgi:hypothetical protein
MAVADKVRWKRLVNQVRYFYGEIDLVAEIGKDASGEFQQFFLNFAARSGLDVNKLNQENQERIRNIYSSPAIENDEFTLIGSSSISALVPYRNISDSNEPEEDTRTYEQIKDDAEIHESFNRLFKKLAMKLHPDKIRNNVTIEQGIENIELFNKAKVALDEKRYFVLLDLAERFGITQSRNYKQQNRWMKRKVYEMEQDISKSKQTYNYKFAECETEEQKERLAKSFINQLFGIILP